MSRSVFLVLIFSICSVINFSDCASSEEKLDHNVIIKDENNRIEIPLDEHSKIVAVKRPLEETKLIKNAIPLVHEKKLNAIRHPLPPSWHDILPHEDPRYNKFDQNKVHQEFLLHEGPKLQRRLHHHYTVEELRQKRKELREKLQARYNKLTHVTPQGLHDKNEGVLKVTPPSFYTSTHSVVRKILETTTPNIEDSTSGNQLKIPPTTTHLSPVTVEIENTTPTLIGYTESQFGVALSKMRKILEHNELTTPELTTKPNLLALLRNKHRFSKNLETTTILDDVVTTTQKPIYRAKFRGVLGSKRNVPTSTETTTTMRDEVSSKKIILPNQDRSPLLAARLSRTTTEVPEITTVDDGEAGKYHQDWKQHLREAIRRRLQKFRRHSAEE